MKNGFISKVSFILITCILIPGAFLLLFELTLRVIDYGYPPEFFVKEKINGKEVYVNNYKFSWRFFPKPMARISASLVVPVKKDKDAMRIFILGESAAQGDPDASFSFSRLLGAMLEKKYPDKKIEIYNAGITAINSNVIVPLFEDCLKLEPDLFIVYMGNNEVIGPYGLSSALTPFFSNSNVIKFQVWLGKTKIGQMIRELSAKKDIDNQEWKGMELFIKNKVRYSSPDLEKIYSHFNNNLTEICQTATKAGVKVILSTVITNKRDCSPFLSLHNLQNKKQLAQWQQFYNEGIKLDSTHQYKEALEQFEKASTLDSGYAELNFRMGKSNLSIGQPERAMTFFTKALNYDALRFRADTKINEIVKNVASTNKAVYLIDSDAAADKESEFGISGSDLLYEHVHLNIKGNYLLAKGILPHTEKALSLKGGVDTVTIATCKKRLSYTSYDESRNDEAILSLLHGAPFINQYTNSVDIKTLENKIKNSEAGFDSLNVRKMCDTYKVAISEYPLDCFLHLNYTKLLYNFDYYAEADNEAEIFYNFLPYEYASSVNRGIMLRGLKKYKESESFYKNAISINPYFSAAYKGLANLYEDMGEFYKSAYNLKKSHSTSDEMAAFYNRTGIYFAEKNNLDSAELYFSKGIAARPDFTDIRKNLQKVLDLRKRRIAPSEATVVADVYNKANALFKQGNFEEAILNYEKAIALNPSFPKAHNNAAIACIKLKRLDEALAHFSEAIKIDPSFFEAYPNIAMLLSQQGRHTEAIEILNKGLKIKADPILYHLMADEYLKMGDNLSAEKCLEQERAIQQLRLR